MDFGIPIVGSLRTGATSEAESVFLNDAAFRQVIETTPLVSIDLVVQNPSGHVLLGVRNYRPAQGFWFVPGGRVRKGETMDAAFARLTLEELGQAFTRDEADFLGLYEHQYADSVFGPSVSTHYVVLAYWLKVGAGLHHLPKQQHAAYRWNDLDRIACGDDVHPHTKAYVPAVSALSRS